MHDARNCPLAGRCSCQEVNCVFARGGLGQDRGQVVGVGGHCGNYDIDCHHYCQLGRAQPAPPPKTLLPEGCLTVLAAVMLPALRRLIEDRQRA